ncbi:MAG: type IV pilus assembly protein PilQ [Planctomycetota bacterium]|jgi:type IV pilus assembly protein PilQ
MKNPILVPALSALLCLLSPAVSAQVSSPDARVSLRVEERALSEVVDYLRDQAGANIVIVEGGDATVSLDLTDVNWLDALEIAAELAGCVVEERSAGILAIERPPRVNFEFDNADLVQVINTIAKLSNANVVVAPEVTGTLSLRLTDVPWRDALDVAVKTLGYTVVEEDRGILRIVDPLSLQAQMETKSYQFRYLRPKGAFVPKIQSEFLVGSLTAGTGDLSKDFPVIDALRNALSQGGGLDYIESENTIIVKDTAQVHAQIKDIIDRLDVEPAQVFIDVKFVSTANDDIFSLGVDFGDLGPQVTASGGQIPITLPFNLGSGGFEDWLIASPGGTGPFVDSNLNGGSTLVPSTIFGSLSFTQVAATLRLLQKDGSSEVLQAPKIIALDGRPSTIFVGETIRYAEAKSEQGQAGGLQLSVSEASSSPVEVGFQLLVIPHLIPGTEKLTLEVIPKETSLSGTGDPTIAPPGFDVFTVGASGLEGSIALPRKRSSTIVTSMLLESGQTAMIGGLQTETDSERHSRVPYLSKIPLLGWLFRHEERSREKRSLMVFITPTIVRSSADQHRLLQRELESRHGAYGERLEEVLFGEAGMPSSAVIGAAMDQESARTTGDGMDYRWSTFVQSSEEGSATDEAAESDSDQ